MKKIIALSIICLIGFGAQAQDKMMKKFKEIKPELNLNEEQDASVIGLMKERKIALDKIKNVATAIMSDEDMNKHKIEKIKKRKEINASFRTNLEALLEEDQLATLNKLMPVKAKKTMQEKDSKPMSPHKHIEGEEHTH